MSKKTLRAALKRTLAVVLATVTVFTTLNLTGMTAEAADATGYTLAEKITAVPGAGSSNSEYGAATIDNVVLKVGEKTTLHYASKADEWDVKYTYGSNPTSSDSSVASVGKPGWIRDFTWAGEFGNLTNSSYSVTIEAKKVGTTVISSYFEKIRVFHSNPVSTASITVTVIPSQTNVTAATESTLDVSLDQTFDFGSTVYGLYDDMTMRPVDGTTFASADDTVATVDANGVITPVTVGTTKVTATSNGFTTECTVTVVCSHARDFSVTEDKDNMLAQRVCVDCGEILETLPTITYSNVPDSYTGDWYYLPEAGFTVTDPTKDGSKFMGWIVNGDTTATAKNFSVAAGTSDIDYVLEATWAESVNATFYLLKPIFDMPGINNSLTPEKLLALDIVSQSVGRYTKTGTGSFYNVFAPNVSYAEDYKNEAYQTSSTMQTVIENELCSVPDASALVYTNKGYKYTVDRINWYVIKQETKDGWHVDGIAAWNKNIIPYYVQYNVALDSTVKAQKVAFDVENPVTIKTEADAAVLISDTAKAAGVDANDYYFDGWYMNADCTVPCTLTSTEAVYTNVILYAKLLPKKDITVIASSLTEKYTGNDFTLDSTYTTTAEGVTVSGITSTVTAQNFGVYSTVTTGTLVLTDAAGKDVTKQYNVTVIEGALNIEKATVTIFIPSFFKTQGSPDPTYTGTVSCDTSYNYGTITFGRRTSDVDLETAGDDVFIVCTHVENDNVIWNITNGRLVISPLPVIETPVIVIPEEPTPTAETPVIPVAPIVVIPEEATPLVEAPVEDELVEEPVITIPEDETPLAEGTDDTLTIPEEDVPLAANLRDGDCWIHWLILLLTVVYAGYSVVRCVARNKKIKELQGEREVATNN